MLINCFDSYQQFKSSFYNVILFIQYFKDCCITRDSNFVKKILLICLPFYFLFNYVCNFDLSYTKMPNSDVFSF